MGSGAAAGPMPGGAGRRHVKIEVLYFDGCPSYESLLPRLRELLDSADIDAHIELHRVETAEAAERQRFLGSPTLRIDGRDVDPAADGRDDYGLKCRLYRTVETTSGVPPEEWISEALEAAARSST